MKRIFLTGASSGIGLATAKALVACGHEVWGTSRDLNRLPRLERFHPVQLDLRQDHTIEQVFVKSREQANGFDVVINNAGSGHFGPAEFLPMADVAELFQILFFAPVRLMQLALAEMRRHDKGLIINVTSLAARLPLPFMAAYNAAKAALATFTMSIQVELAQSAIRVIDLEPADIRTQFNEGLTKVAGNEAYSRAIAETWQIVDRNLKKAPEPGIVANRMIKLIEQSNPAPRVTVGDAFQAHFAPLTFRFLPQRVGIWGLKQYYHLG